MVVWSHLSFCQQPCCLLCHYYCHPSLATYTGACNVWANLKNYRNIQIQMRSGLSDMMRSFLWTDQLSLPHTNKYFRLWQVWSNLSTSILMRVDIFFPPAFTVDPSLLPLCKVWLRCLECFCLSRNDVSSQKSRVPGCNHCCILRTAKKTKDRCLLENAEKNLKPQILEFQWFRIKMDCHTKTFSG